VVIVVTTTAGWMPTRTSGNMELIGCTTEPQTNHIFHNRWFFSPRHSDCRALFNQVI
jgi:hypothetical protein